MHQKGEKVGTGCVASGGGEVTVAVRKNRDKKLEEQEEEKGISFSSFFHWVFYANVSKYLCVYIYVLSVLVWNMYV